MGWIHSLQKLYKIYALAQSVANANYTELFVMGFIWSMVEKNAKLVKYKKAASAVHSVSNIDLHVIKLHLFVQEHKQAIQKTQPRCDLLVLLKSSTVNY